MRIVATAPDSSVSASTTPEGAGVAGSKPISAATIGVLPDPASTAAATSGLGGFEITRMTSVVRVPLQRVNRRAGHLTADLGGQVVAAESDDLADADAPPIEQRHRLLRTRPRCGHHTHRARRDRVGKAEARAAQHRRAGARTHEQQSSSGGVTLERYLLRHRHVVAEQQHMQSVRQSLIRGQRRIVTRHGDDGDIRGGRE